MILGYPVMSQGSVTIIEIVEVGVAFHGWRLGPETDHHAGEAAYGLAAHVAGVIHTDLLELLSVSRVPQLVEIRFSGDA